MLRGRADRRSRGGAGAARGPKCRGSSSIIGGTIQREAEHASESNRQVPLTPPGLALQAAALAGPWTPRPLDACLAFTRGAIQPREPGGRRDPEPRRLRAARAAAPGEHAREEDDGFESCSAASPRPGRSTMHGPANDMYNEEAIALKVRRHEASSLERSRECHLERARVTCPLLRRGHRTRPHPASPERTRDRLAHDERRPRSGRRGRRGGASRRR